MVVEYMREDAGKRRGRQSWALVTLAAIDGRPELPPSPNHPATIMSDPEELTLNLALPKTSATLTVRIIKSFEYRTEKSLVLHKINLETTTPTQLKEIARQGMLSVPSSFHGVNTVP